MLVGSLIPIDLVSHNVVEVVWGNKSIIVQIGLGESVLNALIIQILSQFLGDFLQFKGGESSRSVDIEALKNFVNFGSAFLVTKLLSGESQEFCKVNTSWLIVVEFGENLIYKFVLSSESEALEGSL